MTDIHLVSPHHHAMCEPCRHIDNVNVEMRPWLPLLIREMRKNDGAGITSNQVGQTASVFVTNVEGDHIRIFVNPTIEELIGPDLMVHEGCLSFPGKHLHTQRKRHVVIRAFNLNGHEFVVDTRAKIYNEQTSLMLSVCLQHEMDHIIGIDMREYL